MFIPILLTRIIIRYILTLPQTSQHHLSRCIAGFVASNDRLHPTGDCPEHCDLCYSGTGLCGYHQDYGEEEIDSQQEIPHQLDDDETSAGKPVCAYPALLIEVAHYTIHYYTILLYLEVYPPSTISADPVTNELLPPARYKTPSAISAGSPILCIGTAVPTLSCIAFNTAGFRVVSGVSV